MSSHLVGEALGSAPVPATYRTRLLALLRVVEAEGGRCCANDEDWVPIKPFCDDERGTNTDTFNRAIDAKYLWSSHDSSSEEAYCGLTDKGRAFLAKAAR